jgi:hypothetical protein
MVSKKLSVVPKYTAYDSATAILNLYGPKHDEGKSKYNEILTTVNETENLELLVSVNYGLEVLLDKPRFPLRPLIGVRKSMNKEEIEAQQRRLYAAVNMSRAIQSNPRFGELVAYAADNHYRLADIEVMATSKKLDLAEQTLKWKTHLDKIYVKAASKAQKLDSASEKQEMKYAKLLRKSNRIAEHFQIGKQWSREYVELISKLYNDRTVGELIAPIRGEALAHREH